MDITKVAQRMAVINCIRLPLLVVVKFEFVKTIRANRLFISAMPLEI